MSAKEPKSEEPKKIEIEVIEQRFFWPETKSMQRVLTYGGITIFLFLIGSIAASDYFILQRVAELESRVPSAESLEVLHEELKSARLTLPETVYNLSGPVKNLEEGSFVVDASLFGVRIDDQPVKIVEINEKRKVIVSPDTKFIRLSLVVEGESGRQAIKETPITFGDLKIGDYVEAVSKQGILREQEFEATKVKILPSIPE